MTIEICSHRVSCNRETSLRTVSYGNPDCEQEEETPQEVTAGPGGWHLSHRDRRHCRTPLPTARPGRTPQEARDTDGPRNTLRTRPAAGPEAAGSNVSHQGDHLWSPPPPTTGQEMEMSVSYYTGLETATKMSSRDPPDSESSGARAGRGWAGPGRAAAAGTWTMKYSQKLQPGSVLFSLRVLMSSSNLPRFLVKDMSSNVLSLVRKAFQDS